MPPPPSLLSSWVKFNESEIIKETNAKGWQEKKPDPGKQVEREGGDSNWHIQWQGGKEDEKQIMKYYTPGCSSSFCGYCYLLNGWGSMSPLNKEI